MSAGFYQRLGISPEASDGEVSEAYHSGLARLVRRLRAARSSGANPSALEAERDALSEAYEVINDPARRRRYDMMLALDGALPVGDPAAVRAALEPALEDPAAVSAIRLLAAISTLPLREAEAPAVAQPRRAAPSPKPVSMLTAEQRQERARFAVEAVPEPSSAATSAMRGLRPAPASSAPPALQMRGPSISLAPLSLEPPSHAPPSHAPPSHAPLPSGPNTAERDFLSGTLGFDGRYISAVREAKGVSLDELAETTRISRRYLDAIEASQYDRLPAAVFVRGYLKEIAGVLEIDEQPLITGFMDLYAQHRGG